MSVMEVALIDVIPGKEKDFERDLDKVAPILVQADGCHHVDIVRSVEKPSRYRLLVTWESIDHHVRFRTTKEVVALKAMLVSYTAARHDTEHVTPVFSASKSGRTV